MGEHQRNDFHNVVINTQSDVQLQQIKLRVTGDSKWLFERVKYF